MPRLSLSYDPNTDILEIEGVKYAADLFRTLAFPREDRLFQFKRCEDSVIVFDAGPAPNPSEA
jgi:hypothetical protein